jgi:hypothetical protein
LDIDGGNTRRKLQLPIDRDRRTLIIFLTDIAIIGILPLIQFILPDNTCDLCSITTSKDGFALLDDTNGAPTGVLLTFELTLPICANINSIEAIVDNIFIDFLSIDASKQQDPNCATTNYFCAVQSITDDDIATAADADTSQGVISADDLKNSGITFSLVQTTVE